MQRIAEIDSHELAERLEQDPEGVRLVDVRTPAEINQGVIPGAETVPLHLLPLQAGQWSDDMPTVFYCRTGARSAQACAFMASQGRAMALNLRGGIVDWARRGLPIAPAPAERSVG